MKRTAKKEPKLEAATQPEAAASWCDLGALVPWDKNPRKNKGKPVEKIARSIVSFGFGSPIVAQAGTGRVISGHTRLLACQKLKADYRGQEDWSEDAVRIAKTGSAPVRFISVADDVATKLALADNRVAEESKWDKDQLAEILSELGVEDAMDAGFSAEEFDKLFDTPDVTIEDIDVSEVQSRFYLTASGPLLMQPDALEALKKALVGVDGVQVTIQVTDA